MPHTMPLLPPSLLTPRAARLASSSLAPRRVGAMHLHAHARRVALSSATPLSSSLPRRRRTDKTPSVLSPCKSPAIVHLAARLCLRVHAHTVQPQPSASHHPKLSRRSRCSQLQKRTLPFILSAHQPLPPSDKPSPPHRLSFSLLRRCQAISPHLSPRVQVPELCRVPELLPDQLKSLLLYC
jgi:hypothetical protein